MRRKVQWNRPRGTGATQTIRPHPYLEEAKIPPEEWEIRSTHLTPGELWITAADLGIDFRVDPLYITRHAMHDLSYVSRWRGSSPVLIKKESPVIYMGTVRVEEHRPRSGLVRVLRHTFLFGGLRYMTVDLLDFEPLIDAQNLPNNS